MISDLIKRLGGPGAVAKFLGLKHGDVASAWIMRGQIPWRWRQAVRDMAAAQSIELTEDDEGVLALSPNGREAESMRQGIG